MFLPALFDLQLICLNVIQLIYILSITVYRKEKFQGAVQTWQKVHPGTLSKDMVIITNYDVDSNEEKTLFHLRAKKYQFVRIAEAS